ncbi:hypothetical protein [Catalinimonas niigatensis]|uniref:hypothetical protein n=1 Tax=Catalinimonas niigatensis TaxID=1397264 RepID=UPI0026651341|nr:hypothetical protein [Catalinimonas niigatensis]WPP51432.1 hypothetical protein PZB72_03400 [Catalinimonas niigatensis]
MKNSISILSPTRVTACFFFALSIFFFSSCKEASDIFDGIKDKVEDDDDSKDMDDKWLFASTNTGSNFTIFDVEDLKDIEKTIANTGSMDADGIYYDAEKDIVYQLSRTESVVHAYTKVSELKGTEDVTPAYSSTSDFTSGREITVSGNKLIVAEDVDDMNKLIVYTLGDSAITLDKIYEVDFNLWGIQLKRGTLYAVKDNTNMLAVFEDFLSNPEGWIMPTKSVAIDGIVRTHGVDYDVAQDIMVLTDVGDAESDTDGGVHVIANFSNVLMETADMDTISMDKQRHIAGDKTMLGNPVDAVIGTDKMLYVAERANGGGRFLVFNYPGEYCNVKPKVDVTYEGASAVYLSEKD